MSILKFSKVSSSCRQCSNMCKKSLTIWRAMGQWVLQQGKLWQQFKFRLIAWWAPSSYSGRSSGLSLFPALDGSRQDLYTSPSPGADKSSCLPPDHCLHYLPWSWWLLQSGNQCFQGLVYQQLPAAQNLQLFQWIPIEENKIKFQVYVLRCYKFKEKHWINYIMSTSGCWTSAFIWMSCRKLMFSFAGVSFSFKKIIRRKV